MMRFARPDPCSRGRGYVTSRTKFPALRDHRKTLGAQLKLAPQSQVGDSVMPKTSRCTAPSKRDRSHVFFTGCQRGKSTDAPGQKKSKIAPSIESTPVPLTHPQSPNLTYLMPQQLNNISQWVREPKTLPCLLHKRSWSQPDRIGGEKRSATRVPLPIESPPKAGAGVRRFSLSRDWLAAAERPKGWKKK